MFDTRLAMALDGGALTLPQDGRILLAKPPVENSLSALPKSRTAIVDGFRPAHDLWKDRGFNTQTNIDGAFSSAIICLPRSKPLAKAMIADASVATEGMLVVDGQKTDGIDSLFKEVRKRVAISSAISKAHGKLFWCARPAPDVFEDWRAGPALTQGDFWTAPGVFSADGIDPASALLAAALPEDLGEHVADFGAGWGFLSAHVLTRKNIRTAHLIEAEFMALECAKRNVGDGRAVFHWADATRWQTPKELDAIVMNPPFHTSRAADPSIGKAFIEGAAQQLRPQGSLWMVANRHLPYERTLAQSFEQVYGVGGDARFKLFRAARPKRDRRG